MNSDRVTAQPRDVVFISHANPDDNPAAIWFATQLANEGYRVWSDVIDLTGGEEFWRSIEEVIRSRAIKVVFLLSKSSNGRDGCLKELSVAQAVAKSESLKDFIVPIRIDDLPFESVNIRIHPLFIIDSRSWSNGLSGVLKNLDAARIPRKQPHDFRSTSSWWKGRFATSRSVLDEPEGVYSNWFALINSHLTLYWHRIRRSEIGPASSLPGMPFASFEDSGGLWTFAPSEVVAGNLQGNFHVDRTVEKRIGGAKDTDKADYNIVYRLLNIAWRQGLLARGLLPHPLANDKYCFAFHDGLVDGEVGFVTRAGRKGRRALTGYKMRMDSKGGSWKRYWHFAVEPIPAFSPHLMTMFRTHVVFSEDGRTIWTSPTRLQSARRNQCKNWWNDAWRDRLLATVSWLAGPAATLQLNVGSEEPISFEASPLAFESPVTYQAHENQGNDALDLPESDLDDDTVETEGEEDL